MGSRRGGGRPEGIGSLVPRVLEELRRHDLEHVKVTVGGIVPPGDRDALEKAGVASVFGPGSTTKEIVQFFSGLTTRSEEAVS